MKSLERFNYLNKRKNHREWTLSHGGTLPVTFNNDTCMKEACQGCHVEGGKVLSVDKMNQLGICNEVDTYATELGGTYDVKYLKLKEGTYYKWDPNTLTFFSKRIDDTVVTGYTKEELEQYSLSANEHLFRIIDFMDDWNMSEYHYKDLCIFVNRIEEQDAYTIYIGREGAGVHGMLSDRFGLMMDCDERNVVEFAYDRIITQLLETLPMFLRGNETVGFEKGLLELREQIQL